MGRLGDFQGYIQAAMHSWHCPGTAVAVIRGEEVIHQSVHGLRDVAAGLPVTADTRFPLASVTKSFTAMSVALLVDEGKLEWDKPVREYIPEFVLNDPYVTQHITVRDMLSHRTGLPRHEMAGWRLDVPPAEFIERMRHLKFSASFREKFQYNNLMYYAVAYLVERVAGRSWEDFVHQRIFEPLGMGSSNFRPEPPQPGQPEAKGYRIERDEAGVPTGLVETPVGVHKELSPGAAGALFSTLADLIGWLRVHVNGGHSGQTQLVSLTNLQQMHQPHMVLPGDGISEALMGNTIFTYGLGWFIEPYKGHTLVHHGGNVEGHSLIVGFVPQEQVGVVVLTNAASIPLRDALLYESIDRALSLPDRDWNSRFHKVVDPIFVGRAQSKMTSAAEQVEAAPPSRALQFYTGEFEAKGYPDFAVRLAGGDLEARLVDNLPWSPLNHYHYDVFEWDLPDWETRIKIRFATNANGDLDAVSAPVEPSVDDVVFTRKQPLLAEETIAALTGRYEPPVPGLTFTITAANGKVYFSREGEAPREIRAYKVEEDHVGFRLDRSRLDFEREDGAFVRLNFKDPGLTLVAPRVADLTSPRR